ncbi:aspartic peptidase domain-containing protein [Nemania sp. FL0916]|nr:aspartic peptidase domain-containing protein [Nemania sp. FL0916]
MRYAAGLTTGSLLASAVSAQVVRWDIERRGNPTHRLARRASNTVQEDISNEKMRGGYFASCSIGTPPQQVTLQLDTGSSDIWVPATSSQVCQPQGKGCTLGSYDPDSSKTAVLVSEDFQIAYVDQSYSRGDYINETFAIGNVQLENMRMGLGLDTDIAYGLVGVGYALNEASVAHNSPPYANLPLLMRDEGHINTNAYSLWLNDLDASKGNILFGGIDTDKYKGDLIRVDVQQDPQTEAFTSFIVELTSLGAHSVSGQDALTSSQFPIPVVLDSGTTFTYLPDDIVQEIWKEVGSQYYLGNDGSGAPLVPCALAKNQGYFTFGFGGSGGPMINVTMDELVLPISNQETAFPSGPYKGQAACQFGIQNITQGHYLLGDTFLRSAYVVYDLENNEIGLAPTDFNATTSNVVAFPSQGAPIPSSTAAANQNAGGSGTSSAPDFKASSGFTDLNNDKGSPSSSGGSNGSGNGGGSGGGSGGGGGDDNAGSAYHALDFTQTIVMGASMGLMMFGGGMFLLF